MRRDGFHSLQRKFADRPNRRLNVRAADLLAALMSEAEMERQDPTNPNPKLMLERLRVVGEDKLTAMDGALFQLFLTWARHKGFDQRVHEIDGEVVRTYLKTTRWIDVERSVGRLRESRVAFDIRTPMFREAGEVPPVIVHTRTELKPKFKHSLIFEFPSILTKVLKAAHRYSYLELRAFPLFSSKYSGRLYGLLASNARLKTFTVSPEELAADLGWNPPTWHYGSFRQRCLDPALEDIRQNVRRLWLAEEDVDETNPELGRRVKVTEDREAGRGRRVKTLTVEIFTEAPRMIETKTVRVPEALAARIAERDLVHPPGMIPSVRLLSRACRLLLPKTTDRGHRRRRPMLVDEAWRRTLDHARLGIGGEDLAFDLVHLQGKALVHAIETTGIEAAFMRWLRGEVAAPRFSQNGSVGLIYRNFRVAKALEAGTPNSRPDEPVPTARPGSGWSADEEEALPDLDWHGDIEPPEEFAAVEDIDCDVPF